MTPVGAVKLECNPRSMHFYSMPRRRCDETCDVNRGISEESHAGVPERETARD